MTVILENQDGPQAVLKTRGEWLDQMQAAADAWEELDPPANLAALIELAPKVAFALLQAADALGEPMSDDLRSWLTGEGRFL